MRPDPYTRVRPDRTEFEVVNIRPDVKSLVNVATPGVPESGDSGRDNFTVIGSRSIREEFVPIQSTATWDFGDRIGSDSGYYRTSYLFPHTSRDGTTTLDNLPAYDVKATIGWELYVTLSYQYTYTVRVQVGTECVRYERVPNSPPELPIPGFSIGDCLQERPVYEDQLRGPFNYNSGQVRIFNPNLSAYGLTGDANSRVTYELHKKVVVVQTDILDGSGAQPNGANGTYPNTPLQLYTPRP